MNSLRRISSKLSNRSWISSPNDLPNRFCGAVLQSFDAKLDLRICHRLTENNALAEVVVTAEEIGRIVGAETTVGAAAIDIKATRGVLRETVFNVGHG
jgi:hypothetical protein